VTGRFSTAFSLDRREGDGVTEEMNGKKTFLAVKTFERIVA
jgi:hypothetical protein